MLFGLQTTVSGVLRFQTRCYIHHYLLAIACAGCLAGPVTANPIIENPVFKAAGGNLGVNCDIRSPIFPGANSWDNLPLCFKVTLWEEDVVFDDNLGTKFIKITQENSTQTPPIAVGPGGGFSYAFGATFANAVGYGTDYYLTIEPVECPTPEAGTALLSATGILGTVCALRCRRSAGLPASDCGVGCARAVSR